MQLELSTPTAVCVKCDQIKPVEQFVNDRTRPSGKFPWCKPCVRSYRDEARAKESVKVRVPAVTGERRCEGCLCSLEGEHANRIFCSMPCKGRVRRWRAYGLAPDEYRALIASNHGKCPICAKEVTRWVIDHNHTTGEVTGATCSPCNQALLTYTFHDVGTAERLVQYLADHPLRHAIGERRYVGPESLAQLEREKGWRRYKGYSVGFGKHQHISRAGGEWHT